MEGPNYNNHLKKKNNRTINSIHPYNIIYVEYFNKLKRRAAAQGKTNLVISFKKIVSSIYKYPLPIENCFDAFKLKGVGKNFSYYFEKALSQAQREDSYKDGIKNISIRNDINLTNHVNKIVKNANILLHQYKDAYNLQIKDEIQDIVITTSTITPNNTLLKQKEKNEQDDKHKKEDINNEEVLSPSCNFDMNNSMLNEMNHAKKKCTTDIPWYRLVSDYINESVNKKKNHCNSVEETTHFIYRKEQYDTNYEEASEINNEDMTKYKSKKKKEVQLNDIEIRILTILYHHGESFEKNAMSKEEINIEILKRFKINVNLNLKSIYRLIKLELVEKIEVNEPNIMRMFGLSTKKKKMQNVAKLKLTEKGKAFMKREIIGLSKNKKKSEIEETTNWIIGNEKGKLHNNDDNLDKLKKNEEISYNSDSEKNELYSSYLYEPDKFNCEKINFFKCDNAECNENSEKREKIIMRNSLKTVPENWQDEKVSEENRKHTSMNYICKDKLNTVSNNTKMDSFLSMHEAQEKKKNLEHNDKRICSMGNAILINNYTNEKKEAFSASNNHSYCSSNEKETDKSNWRLENIASINEKMETKNLINYSSDGSKEINNKSNNFFKNEKKMNKDENIIKYDAIKKNDSYFESVLKMHKNEETPQNVYYEKQFEYKMKRLSARFGLSLRDRLQKKMFEEEIKVDAIQEIDKKNRNSGNIEEKDVEENEVTCDKSSNMEVTSVFSNAREKHYDNANKTEKDYNMFVNTSGKGNQEVIKDKELYEKHIEITEKNKARIKKEEMKSCLNKSKSNSDLKEKKEKSDDEISCDVVKEVHKRDAKLKSLFSGDNESTKQSSTKSDDHKDKNDCSLKGIIKDDNRYEKKNINNYALGISMSPSLRKILENIRSGNNDLCSSNEESKTKRKKNVTRRRKERKSTDNESSNITIDNDNTKKRNRNKYKDKLEQNKKTENQDEEKEKIKKRRKRKIKENEAQNATALNKVEKKKNKRREERKKEIKETENEITYGPFEIVIVIDNRDVSGVHCIYYEKIKKIFKENNIKYITRNLPLGDVIWLLRRAVYRKMSEKKTNKQKIISEACNEKKIEEIKETLIDKNSDKKNDTKNFVNNIDGDKKIEECVEYEEYVLKWIIERKTLNDLSASIIDGRYDEQKYRLMRAKDVNHIIYLIENSNNSFKNYTNSSKIPYETLQNAKNSIQLVSGFSILNSLNMKHTIFLLSELHFKILKHIKKVCNIEENEFSLHSDKILEYLQKNASSWKLWNEDSKKSKNNIVKEVFGKQLRLINMCGADATELILSLWPTPIRLNQALNRYTHDGILAEKLRRIYIKNYALQGKKKVKSPVSAQLIAILRQLYAPDTI